MGNNKIVIKRGLESNIPALDIGELCLATDTGNLYVGTSDGNVNISQQIITDEVTGARYIWAVRDSVPYLKVISL